VGVIARSLVVDDALSASAHAIVRDPDLIDRIEDATHLVQVGCELRDLHHILALRAHLRAVEVATGDVRVSAWTSLASTQRRNQQPKNALDSIQRSLDMDSSLDTNIAAYTCRVAALRDLGELPEARLLGENLYARHPDDPKLLRALAAVYRDLSTGGDEFDEWADRLFALANELEHVRSPDYAFSDLRNATPQLVELLEDAVLVRDSGERRFCAFEVWTDELRPRLDVIANDQASDPRLRTDRAYELIGLLAYQRLPPCRDCGRLYEVDT
jgi:tetratricopeptide (TPR) repeat protein